MPSAEQSAFRFSCTLLVLDDIIASTALQEQPTLYEYHRNLLSGTDGSEAPINLEGVIGCQNWALLQIGEVAVLDAWKQRCKIEGNLDVMDLVRRATTIKDALETQRNYLENNPTNGPEISSAEEVLSPYQSSKVSAGGSWITRVWAHAALVYLSVVVSGWQPASADVRYHVSAILDLLTNQMSSLALLRTVVWPFCVAGCLAERAQEASFRTMVEALRPSSVFGTVRTALEIMEDTWRNREIDVLTRDLATCFRSQGHLVLLV